MPPAAPQAAAANGVTVGADSAVLVHGRTNRWDPHYRACPRRIPDRICREGGKCGDLTFRGERRLIPFDGNIKARPIELR